MKKMIYIIVLAVLCLSFSIHAQENKAIDVTASGIQIGQKVPDILLNNIHNYKTKTAKLSDFKGKLLILDFWATWCSPCVAMIPKMEALQKQFNNSIQILPVSYQAEKDVLPFLLKLNEANAESAPSESTKSIIPQVVADKDLHKLFPHVYLPHYVWIDKNGVVKAITDHEAVTSDNIQKMLNNQKIKGAQKIDTKMTYDMGIPLLINGNGGNGENLIYHSTLAGYKEGLSGKFAVKRTDSQQVNRITLINCPLLWLYKHAYGNGLTTYFQDNKILLDVEHPEEIQTDLRGKSFHEWISKPGRGFCYELSVPPGMVGQFYTVMQQEMVKLFPQYRAVVEKRKMKSMVLVRLPGEDKIKTSHPNQEVLEQFDQFGFSLQNSFIYSFMDRIQLMYQQNSPMPFIDQTDYNGRIDMDVKANLADVKSMNLALKKYNLQWEEKMVEQEVLVIMDNKQQDTAQNKSL